jgi:hypothetical protein
MLRLISMMALDEVISQVRSYEKFLKSKMRNMPNYTHSRNQLHISRPTLHVDTRRPPHVG